VAAPGLLLCCYASAGGAAVRAASDKAYRGSDDMMSRITTRTAGGLLLCLACRAPVFGQDASRAAPPEPAPAPAPAPTPTPLAATPHPARRVAAPTLAIGVGGPMIVSGSAGLILGTDRALPDECPSPRGFLLQAEAGVGGLQIGLGPVFTYCHTARGSLGAATLQAAYLRTWGNPLGTDPDLDYWGGVLRIGLIDWRITLGLLKRTAGGDVGANLLFTWGVARGF
jgi:hypothetical protein